MSFSSGLWGCGGGTSVEGDCISWELPAMGGRRAVSGSAASPPRRPQPCRHPPALRDISASLRGRSEGLTPAGEPRMSGRALRRPVLPEDAKSSTGSTSVMLALERHRPLRSASPRGGGDPASPSPWGCPIPSAQLADLGTGSPPGCSTVGEGDAQGSGTLHPTTSPSSILTGRPPAWPGCVSTVPWVLL